MVTLDLAASLMKKPDFFPAVLETFTCDSNGSRDRYMSVHIRYFNTLNVAFVISHHFQFKKKLLVTVAVVSSDNSLLSVIFYRYVRTVVSLG